MARGLNTITLLGALTQNSELKYTQGGLAILEIPLAGIEHVTDENGDPRQLNWYHRVTLFGKPAEDMVDQLKQGTIAIANGRLNHRTWQDATTKLKRSSLDINANRVDIVKTTPNPDAITTDARNQPVLATGAINRVEIIGNLTRDADHRLITGKDYGVNRLSVAINEQYQARNREQQNRTHFVDAEAWRDLASSTQELTKGTPVHIIGRLQTDNWIDKDDNKRYINKIQADVITELARPATTPGANPSNNTNTTSEPEQQLPF